MIIMYFLHGCLPLVLSCFVLSIHACDQRQLFLPLTTIRITGPIRFGSLSGFSAYRGDPAELKAPDPIVFGTSIAGGA